MTGKTPKSDKHMHQTDGVRIQMSAVSEYILEPVNARVVRGPSHWLNVACDVTNVFVSSAFCCCCCFNHTVCKICFDVNYEPDWVVKGAYWKF